MAAWKQFLFAVVIMAVAAGLWVRYFPGAPDILARWGIDWAQAATPRTQGTATAGAGRQGAQRAGGVQMAVVTAPVETATINDRLSAIGTGRANNSVTINPYASGRLTKIAVTSGAVVEAGTVLATLDSEAEQIALDRAKIGLDDAQAKLDRMNALRTSNTSTAVQVKDAELVLGNARLALRDAELSLERRSIVAPISGIVGILPVEAGNYVTSQTVIATIDDRSRIKVDFHVPERFATNMAVGGIVTATPIARPDEVFEGIISAVDNRLDEQSRTLLVQAEIANTNDKLRAGMSFRVTMKFPGDSYPSVDPLAIQWGSDGAFVWVVREGKARRTPVRIVQRNTENVLVAADFGAGDVVVTEGIHAVRDGADVLVAKNDPAASMEKTGTVPPAAAGSGS